MLIHITARYNELSFSAIVFSSLNTNLWRFDSKSRNSLFCYSSSGKAPVHCEKAATDHRASNTTGPLSRTDSSLSTKFG